MYADYPETAMLERPCRGNLVNSPLAATFVMDSDM